MAKKRKAKPKGDDLLELAKYGVKANVVLGVANTVIGTTKN